MTYLVTSNLHVGYLAINCKISTFNSLHRCLVISIVINASSTERWGVKLGLLTSYTLYGKCFLSHDKHHDCMLEWLAISHKHCNEEMANDI